MKKTYHRWQDIRKNIAAPPPSPDYAQLTIFGHTVDLHGAIDVATNRQTMLPPTWHWGDPIHEADLEELACWTRYSFSFTTTDRDFLAALTQSYATGRLPAFRFEQSTDDILTYAEGDGEISELTFSRMGRDASTQVYLIFTSPGPLQIRTT